MTLTGGGTVTLASGLGASQAGNTLVNVNNTIDGYGQLGGTGLMLANRATGVIDSTSGLVLNVGTGTVVNAGLIEATTGNLTVASAISNAATASLSAAGADIILQDGSSVTGGTLSSSGGGEIVVSSGSTLTTLKNLTNVGTVLVSDYSTGILLGTITNPGLIAEQYVHGTGLLVGPGMGAAGTVTLTGGGTLTLASALQANQAGDTLVNVNNTIDGYDVLGNGTDLVVINDAAGVILAQSGDLYVNTGTVALQNAGLMQAGMSATGTGTLIIDTTVDNGASGQMDAAGANIILSNSAVIRGGTLTSSHGGSIVVETSLGVLDGTAHALTNDAYVEVTDYSAVQLEGTIINNGEIYNDYVHGRGILVASGTTLTNNGTLFSHDLNTSFGPRTVLTNDARGTLTGGTYVAQDSTLSFASPAVTEIAGNTVLEEDDGSILFGGKNVCQSLKGIPEGATFIVGDSTTTGSATLSNAGTLQLDNASYQFAKLTNEAGGVIDGNGGLIGTVVNDGTIDATTGELYINGASQSIGGTFAGETIGFGNANLASTITLLSSTVFDAANLEVVYNSTLDTKAKLTIGGTLTMDGQTTLTGSSVTLTGFLEALAQGNGQHMIASPLTSSGTIQVDGNATLNVTGGLANTGLITADGSFADTHALTGGSLAIGQSGAASLATAAAANSTLAVLDSAGGALTTNGTLTVTRDYDNSAAGTGNSYTPFAGVTGTIDAKGAALSVVGVDGTRITSVNGTQTITLAAGQTAHFEIRNAGPASATLLRGALETTVNGGSITGTNLTGSGVTAANFGARCGGAASRLLAKADGGGGLSGEAIHIASDFANVAGITIDIVAKPPADAPVLSLAEPDAAGWRSEWMSAALHHRW